MATEINVPGQAAPNPKDAAGLVSQNQVYAVLCEVREIMARMLQEMQSTNVLMKTLHETATDQLAESRLQTPLLKQSAADMADLGEVLDVMSDIIEDNSIANAGSAEIVAIAVPDTPTKADKDAACERGRERVMAHARQRGNRKKGG